MHLSPRRHHSGLGIIRQILTFLAILAAFVANIWTNLKPLNGQTIADISQTLFQEVLLTPANYAFAVWGLIYLGLISFAFYQALPTQRANPLIQKIGYKLVIASFAQIVWLVCFLSGNYPASFLAMIGILFSLIGAYWSLPFKIRITPAQKWLIRFPISIYLSWISVATIVNGAIVLDYWQWNGWGISYTSWTIIMLLLAGLLTHFVVIPRLDFAYAGIFVWAAMAIAVKNSEQILIAGTAIGISISLIILLLSFSFYDHGSGQLRDQ